MVPKKRKTGNLRNLKRPSVKAATAARLKGGAQPVGGPKPAEPITEFPRK